MNKTLASKKAKILGWIYSQRENKNRIQQEGQRQKEVTRPKIKETISNYNPDDPDLAVNKILKQGNRPSLNDTAFARWHDRIANANNQKLIREGKKK